MSVTKPKSHERLARMMKGLRPGDVLTGFDCSKHQHHQVLVLERKGQKFEFSRMAPPGVISIARDEKGPWTWDDRSEMFMNEEGVAYDHIAPGIEVLEAAGLEQVQWYRELPHPNMERWRISPENLIGMVNDPAMSAKLEALLDRLQSADDEYATVRTISQVIELVFAGSGQSLDERRLRWLHVIVNSITRLALSREQRGLPQGLDSAAEALMGIFAMSDLMGAMSSDRPSRGFGERSARSGQPARRGNGHAHGVHGG